MLFDKELFTLNHSPITAHTRLIRYLSKQNYYLPTRRETEGKGLWFINLS